MPGGDGDKAPVLIVPYSGLRFLTRSKATRRIRTAFLISSHRTSYCETGPDFMARLSSSSSSRACSRVMSNLPQCRAGLEDRN
jgi:hypothetical protein